MRHTRTPFLARTAGAALLASLLTLAPLSEALGQHGGRGGPSGVGRSLLHRQNTGGFRTGLSGVKSQPARPIRSLGGVKAELPRPIANRGSLLPPSRGHQQGGHDRGATRRDPRREIPGARFQDDFIRDGRRGGDDDRFRIGFDSRSGFRASGEFGDDNFRGRFSLNPGGVLPLHDGRGDRRHHHHGTIWPSYAPWSLYGYGYGWGWYDNYYDRYDYAPAETISGSPVYVVDPQMFGYQPQAQPTTPPAPPTPLDLADFALYEGRLDDAVTAYRDHLEKTPEDADAMRRLAIALIQNRKVKEGVALMSMAYDKDLSLVRKPIDTAIVPDGDRAFRDIIYQVVPFANSMKSASGYLAVTVIMQAEGRDAQALKLLRKAKDAGLDEKLAAEFETELGG